MKTGILERIASLLSVGLPAAPGVLGHRGTGKSRSVAAHTRYRLSGHPNAPRHWHDASKPEQAAARAAAKAKRERKAKKLENSTDLSFARNLSHHSGGLSANWYMLPKSLNPFYIAK